MAGSIYLLGDDGKLVTMDEQAYDSEDLLQELLANYPSLLAGDQINPTSPRAWLLVRREAGIPGEDGGGSRWSVDHLFLDQDGVPTLVEVKRSCDTRLRREVVGQLLDYAANSVVYWPADRIRALFEAECESSGQDAEAKVRDLGLEDIEAFWSSVKTNLQAGRVRLVFVADVIPPELARVVEFLNEQMDPAEVLALEVRQFVGEGRRTLVPRVLGQTVQAQQKKSAPRGERRQWDQPSFFAEFETAGRSAEARVAQRLLDWGVSKDLRLWWGQGASNGSFFPTLDLDGIEHYTFAVWTYGSVEMQFQGMRKAGPFASEAARRELCARLNAVEGISIPEDRIALRPSIRLTALERPGCLDGFLGVWDWYVERVRASSRPGAT